MRIAGKFLTQGQWGGVLRMGAANFDDILVTNKLPRNVAHIIPLLLLIEFVPQVFSDFPVVEDIIEKTLKILAILLMLRILESILHTTRDYLKTLTRYKDKPIHSYIQVFMIFMWLLAIFSIFAIAILWELLLIFVLLAFNKIAIMLLYLFFLNLASTIFYLSYMIKQNIMLRDKILIFFLFLGVASLATNNRPFWGQTGHRVVGEIANNHLTKKAKRNIEKLLKGEGLATISTFADEIKSDNSFRKYSSWHYVNFKVGETYEISEKNPKGDLVQGIKICQQIILDPKSNNEDKIFHLKLLVHLIGDLHQPLHTGRAEDRGGNMIKVKWFRGKTNLHSVWDTKMIESYNMTYTELSTNLDYFSKNQKEAIQKGTVIDWVNESRELSMNVYDSAKIDQNLSYRYMYDHFSTVKIQLRKGGLRLAKVLNELFG